MIQQITLADRGWQSDRHAWHGTGRLISRLQQTQGERPGGFRGCTVLVGVITKHRVVGVACDGSITFNRPEQRSNSSNKRRPSANDATRTHIFCCKSVIRISNVVIASHPHRTVIFNYSVSQKSTFLVFAKLVENLPLYRASARLG